ncbi:Hypothetical predicted protein [Podarcis lilfordi]|uniref:Uncharacterized protein n=1 Tax=Podarcis lilfordi TaxID=74358 RepID=A0AA35KRE6_9SAUR|nr:Hypothetical predicted protein [Podarcis lilfordi]
MKADMTTFNAEERLLLFEQFIYLAFPYKEERDGDRQSHPKQPQVQGKETPPSIGNLSDSYLFPEAPWEGLLILTPLLNVLIWNGFQAQGTQDTRMK